MVTTTVTTTVNKNTHNRNNQTVRFVADNGSNDKASKNAVQTNSSASQATSVASQTALVTTSTASMTQSNASQAASVATSNASSNAVSQTQATSSSSTTASQVSSQATSVASQTTSAATSAATSFVNSTANNTNSQAVATSSLSSEAPEKVNYPSLSQAVDKAESAGVKVTKGETITVANTSQANVEYESQVAEINSAAAQQQANINSFQAAEASYKKKEAAYEAYEKQLDQYNKDEANWQKQLSDNKMTDYNKLKNSNFNPDGLNPEQVKNYLTLGAEPDANVSYQILDNNVQAKQEEIDTTGSNHGNWEGLDSKGEIKVTTNRNITMDKPVIKVTYTNLKNSFYDNKPISKIVRVFSFSGGVNGTGNPEMDIYDDPSENLNFGNVNGVDVTTTYYDANGNEIKIDPKNPAYMAVTSLNDWWGTKTDNDNGGNAINNNQGNHADHVEYVQALSGCTAEALQGSPVSVHNGNTLYSDTTNGNTLPDGTVWDKSHSPLQFYGSGIIKLTSGTSTVRYGVYLGKNETTKGSGAWVTSTTTLPATPPVKPTVPGEIASKGGGDVVKPVAPTMKNMSVTYYDVQVQPEKITVHYINDTTGKEMDNMPIKTVDGLPGDQYHETQPDVSGYTKGKETGLPADGTIPDKGGDIYFHYDKQPVTVHVHYINDDTGKEMDNMPVKDFTGKPGDKYNETQPDVKGFIDDPETGLPATGTIPDKGGDIYFHYKTETGRVHVTYVDQNGKPISTPTDETGKTGTEYHTTPKDIPGYHLEKETGAPSNGTYNNGEQDVTYHYVKDIPAPTSAPSQAPSKAVSATPQPASNAPSVSAASVVSATPVAPSATPMGQFVSAAPQPAQPAPVLPTTGDDTSAVSAEALAVLETIVGAGLAGKFLKKNKQHD